MSEPTSDLSGTPVDPDLDAGAVIGEYRIEAKVGQGGFGTVYRAVHPLIGKVVAIKVLARKYSVDPEMVSRFIAEARSVNQIRSRFIIDIFLFGTLPDGRAYYVMEFLDGEALDATLERRGRLPLAEALPILRAVARALDAAHAKGIAHRDLKPENVFLVHDTDSGELWPKLLDFGIAKLMAAEDPNKHKTRTGIPIGTPYYMSPEQCRGKDVDHRTDYYAFGVVAYQMLTGQHPIDADDYMTIMMRQLTDEPVAPSTIVPELPPDVDDAIAWLMKKDREQRPPNLVTAVRALEQAAEASGIAIPRSMPWDGQTPPPGSITPGSLARTPSAQLGSSTAPGAASAGLATTMPSGVAPELAVPKRSKLPLTIAAVLLLAAVAVIGVALGLFGGVESPRRSEVATQPPTDKPPTPPTPPSGDKRSPPIDNKPAAPATAIITVGGVPEGTEVSIAGKPIGVAPGPVQVPRGADPIVLTFKADTYVPQSKTVTPDRDQPLDVQLKARPHGPSGKKPTKDDIIDVFGKKP